ncbi:MAG TPA: substrate-binding domain-containing protein [Verrucomicrobiae bacterium]|nr:substrate-binding domain-containing protein [Verrucomicrobiae bacterium]
MASKMRRVARGGSRGSEAGAPSVAVCIDSRDGPGRERLLGVYRFAVERGWRLYLLRGEEPAVLGRLGRLPLDGAILYDKPASFHRALRARRVPCVETAARNLEFDDLAVFVDDGALARLAVEHLAGLGLNNYAYCGLARRLPSVRRAESFEKHVAGRGPCVAMFEESVSEGEAGLDRLIRWLRRLPKPVGLLAYDDKMAERVLAACGWAGIPVPDDVAVLGIGNDELMCQLAHPALSSVALPTAEIGRRAAESLDRFLRGRAPKCRLQAVVPTEVIARASTDRYPTSDPLVAGAIAFLVGRDSTPIGTDQVAAALGLSRRTLERRFRAVMGRTVHDFLTERRMRRAAELLRLHPHSLSEVAARCGYGALSAFIRAFNRAMGCHPREYRARYR